MKRVKSKEKRKVGLESFKNFKEKPTAAAAVVAVIAVVVVRKHLLRTLRW